jgi:hypothetical protein
MKKNQTVFTKSFFFGIAPAVVILAGLSGCITAATVATIAYIASQTSHTAVVLLDVSPDKVYVAMKKIARATEGLEIKKDDPENRTMKVQKAKNSATVSVKRLESGKTELKVTASANEENLSHEDLALRVVERVCKELGVRYQVVEKDGKLD